MSLDELFSVQLVFRCEYSDCLVNPRGDDDTLVSVYF